MPLPDLNHLIDEWMGLDPNPVTRSEIQDLVKQNNLVELERRLNGRMVFGTAGLRAVVGAGFTRMNHLTILQTTRGLAKYLLASIPDAKKRGVVIGVDCRFSSGPFEQVTKDCLTSFGIAVFVFGTMVHTPMVPFAVDMLRAAAGVMITASHNPKEYNGYKVFWENGVQIIPPHDDGIAAAIEENLKASLEPASASTNLSRDIKQELNVDRAYYECVQKLVPRSFPVPPFVYTPLHGTGYLPLSCALEPFQPQAPVDPDIERRFFKTYGINFLVVKDQLMPNGDFPTVNFPNPEEIGALDLAKALADQCKVSLVVANDPDADRLAVAQKLDSSNLGIAKRTLPADHWHQFTGNELGVLLASHVLEEAAISKVRAKLAFLNSTVSTGMLRVMAESHGHYFAETLTGFKWLGNIARDLESKGFEVPFAFEEALGYMFPSVVHDKDGIAAAVVFVYAVSKWKAQGLTPWQKLQQLYEKYGYFVEANTYLTSPSADVTNSLFNNIRSLGNPYPSHVGSFRILRWRDLTVGYDSATEDNKPDLPPDPKSQMITCELENNVRFTVRGSGTEPKIKFYVECQADTWREADQRAKAAQLTVIKEWFVSDKHPLRIPHGIAEHLNS